MVNLILGSPGSGKGSIATLLEKEKGIKHISTGDILRQEIASKSSLGEKVKLLIADGDLVDDNTMAEIISSTLNKDQSSSYLLDGFPRTLNQAKLLEEIVVIDNAILLEVSSDIVIKRILGRRVCAECQATFNDYFSPSKVQGKCDDCSGDLEQRSDDTEKSVRHRLKIYEENIAEIKKFYQEKNKLQIVDGEDTIANTYQKFLSSITKK